MTEMHAYTPGTFSWLHLSTTDIEGAKQFYSGLFGWQTQDVPAGEAGTYTMARLKGKDVAGMAQMSQERPEEGHPPYWLSYISVANVDESAEQVKSLGGTMLAEPFDVMEVGRMGVVKDPTGAVFALWEAKKHIGAGLVNEPGTLSWNELATREPEKAKDFYVGLFGWKVKLEEMPQTVYTTFVNGERMNGGMLKMTEEWGDMPAHWMVYFTVEDCDASAEKAKALGGNMAVPPTDIPSVGRFSVIQDPQGATFTVIKLNNPE